jgi:predicted nuclease with TOPRIM domain
MEKHEGKNETTKVRFDLWAVLAFITLFAFGGFSFLFNSLSESRAERIANDERLSIRLTRLEANYEFIISGISDLRKGQEKIAESLNEHEKSTRMLKRWQDYPANR